MEQLSLPLEVIAVLCFFNCPYVARAVDPQEAHDLMERHYAEKHAHQIERICHENCPNRSSSSRAPLLAVPANALK